MADKKNTGVDDAELTQILADVQTEIDGLLKSEADRLSKAHPGESTSSETEPDESATSPSSDEGSSAPAGDGDGDADDSASTAPEGSTSDAVPPAPAADASASAPAADDGSAAPGADAGGDPAADASTNPEELVPHYAKLPIEALKAHYLAAKMALAAMMGSAGGAGDASAAPPAPAPDASADASAPPAIKGEMGASLEQPEGNGDDPLHPKAGKKVEKSEKDVQIEQLQAQLTEQSNEMSRVVAAFTKIVETPVRKSVTASADLPAPPAAQDVTKLSKSEIDAKVRRAVETNLTKSDRELITSYALGNVGVDKIAHLLK